MRLRPQQSHRFILYTPHSDTVRTLEILARSGTVQIDTQPVVNATLDVGLLLPLVTRFERLLHDCGTYLPEYQACPLAPRGALDVIAADALNRLSDWCGHARMLAGQRDALCAERGNLQLIAELLAHTQTSQQDLVRFGTPSELLYKGLFACPQTQAPQHQLRNVLEELVQGDTHRFYLYIGLPEQRTTIESALTPVCTQLTVPDWLHNSLGDWRELIRQRLVTLAAEIAAADTQLAASREEPRIIEALGEMSLLRWYLRQARTLSADENFCHVSGWTTAPAALRPLLEQAGIKALLRFPPAARFGSDPVTLHKSGWLAPFEVFLSLYGTPDENEIDPRPLLAVIVPLLFGYMFPDVGHGLLLAAFGYFFYQRWPEARFLLPCGLTASVFGLLFGEVFGFDDWIAPLWIHPLDDPLTILLVPMVFGIGLILLGIVLGGLQALWRGAGWRWLLSDAAVVPLYLGTLVLPWWPAALPIPLTALAWFILGAVLRDIRTPLHALRSALMRLLESAFQLLTHSLSFARVGAFALAHAGLSKALVYLGAGIDNPLLYTVYMLIGQALILTLETLIVFVQTVRLVVLEFFLRFLRAEGRPFAPLRPPQP